MGNRLCVSLLMLVLSLCAIGSPSADPSRRRPYGPKRGITLGPSAGWITGEEIDSGATTGVDLTYFHKIRFPLYFWGSAGARVWVWDQTVPVLPYVETGLSLLLASVGVGYALGLHHPSGAIHHVSLITGLNAPLWSPKKRHLFYLQAYYRPTWDVSHMPGSPVHEIGGYLKWCLGYMR
ncbi:MAG: hypothetical protein QNJ97_20725 [Myxococcota bacterium]|nr:hypothetical protein [Myxococcota bacterium]